MQIPMGECSVNSSLQADSKVKFAVWLRVGGHLALTFAQMTQSELSHMLAL